MLSTLDEGRESRPNVDSWQVTEKPVACGLFTVSKFLLLYDVEESVTPHVLNHHVVRAISRLAWWVISLERAVSKASDMDSPALR